MMSSSHLRPIPPVRKLSPFPLPHIAQQGPKYHPNSTEDAYLLVVGPYNSGKSSTINTLFNHRPISVTSTATTSFVEFSTNYPSHRNLKILDTPGFFSTSRSNSLGKNSQIVATLKKYLDTDPHLSHCLPNVVLIVARFDDPHLTNPKGAFVSSLVSLNLLNGRLFDRSSCNVVILLTHLDEGHIDYQASPELRRDEVMDLVKNWTNYPQMPYIIWGENLEEPSAERINSYEDQLMQLIVKISAGSTRGALGPDFFRSVFEGRDGVFLWKSCTLPLVKAGRSRWRVAEGYLKDVIVSKGMNDDERRK